MHCAGFVLGNASATVSDVAAATAAMRHDGYWQMPVALAKSVPHAIVLGGVGKETPFLGRFNKNDHFTKTGSGQSYCRESTQNTGVSLGVSLPAVMLPPFSPGTAGIKARSAAAAAGSWGSAALTQLAAHSAATTNASNTQMAMVVALDPCEGERNPRRFSVSS